MPPSTTPNNSNRDTRISTRRRAALFVGLGIATMLLVWQVVSLTLPRVTVASPAETFDALVGMMGDGELWSHFGRSLARLSVGLGAGAVAGITLGIAAGLNSRLRLFFEPMRWGAMTVPVIIISVLAMLWFGMGSVQVIIVTAIITMPTNYVNTLEGMLAIDARIIEMADVFRIPRRLRITQIYLPGISSAAMAGLTVASGIGVRASILAEFMGARDGIGHRLFLSWTFLDTPTLFAWILVTFGLLALVEFGVLRPIRNRLMRWRQAP
jgi:NitT/TauT family transport system permease protein